MVCANINSIDKTARMSKLVGTVQIDYATSRYICADLFAVAGHANVFLNKGGSLVYFSIIFINATMKSRGTHIQTEHKLVTGSLFESMKQMPITPLTVPKKFICYCH